MSKSNIAVRPSVARNASARKKIDVAPIIAAANDRQFATSFNEFGVIEEPKLAVAYTGKGNKAEATLWATPVDGEWFGGFDYAFRTGQYQSETMLPSQFDQGFSTASEAIESSAQRLLANLDDKFSDLTILVKREANEVKAMRGWLTAQIEVAQSGGFEEKPAFTFIDLFSGIGGFHLGLSQAGGKCVLACEKDAEARKTYLQNHNMTGVPFAEDITTLNAENVPDHDVMTAGFPCQAFSIGGKKQGFEDERGELIFHLFRIIETKLPKVILSENVKNFCTGEGALTPRERARLQGFPDTFKPHPVKTHANKQFGNSVAVPVIKALGQAIANQFFSQAA